MGGAADLVRVFPHSVFTFKTLISKNILNVTKYRNVSGECNDVRTVSNSKYLLNSSKIDPEPKVNEDFHEIKLNTNN